MKAPLKNILRMMEKESRLGYGDYAVFGGFSEFVRANLELYPGAEQPLAAEALRRAAAYGAATRRERQQLIAAIAELIFRLDSEEGGAAAAQPSPTVQTAAQPKPAATPPAKPKAAKPAAKAPAPAKTTSAAAPRKAAKSGKTADANSPQWLKNVGPKRAELLKKLGVLTVDDLLEYFPRRHEDRRELTAIAELSAGALCTIRGTVGSISASHLRRNMQIIKATLRDGSGSLPVVWFNQPWLTDQIHAGDVLTVYGRFDPRYGKGQFMAAEHLTGEADFGILPVYALTEGLTQKALRSIVQSALDARDGAIGDGLPPALRETYKLCDRDWAVRHYHFPQDLEELERARRRLVFEEFFLMRLAFGGNETPFEQSGVAQAGGKYSDFCKLLPFTPTGAQKRAIGEIWREMAGGEQMVRLLEGDVGSGKTVVAAAAIYRARASGHQSALMAPTEILANQHYESLCRLFDGSGVRLALLTGSTKAKERARIATELNDGKLDLVIGTHALIEDKPIFRDLSLVIVDEQHRFGVNQREKLAAKGGNPDLLVLTATPIPRTLAMTIFAGLSVSVLDEMPPGRKPILTYVLTPRDESRALALIRREIENGGQAYIICPLVGESESLDLAAATELYDHLHLGYFKDTPMGLVHGRLRGAEKDRIMAAFRAGELKLLVATTVIEVGVDVPQATVMLVRDAHRFGLAQLHQMRGRIGRGDRQSYCLLENGGRSELAKERLEIMARCADGFKIAEEDLRLRGPGDFFGTRQHGLAELKIADLYVDSKILTEAALLADVILKKNPKLAGDEYRGIRALLRQKYDIKF